MKNKIIVLNIISVFIVIIMCSYSSGPASHSYDCTGAETGLQNPKGCKTCHGSTASLSTQISLELDSLGVATTHYSGGLTYTVKLLGVNNSNLSLPQFGFQVSCIKGNVAVVTPVNAGTWTAPFPTYTHHSNPSAGNYVTSIVEHSIPLPASTGGGANGSTYIRSFIWKAPVSGTGNVSFWAVMNLVNGNGNNDTGDKWNTNQMIVPEWPITTEVSSVNEKLEIDLYPNPSENFLHLNLKNFNPGTYTLLVYDLSGSLVENKSLNIGNDNFNSEIDVSSWHPGVYKVAFKKDKFMQVVSIVKL